MTPYLNTTIKTTIIENYDRTKQFDWIFPVSINILLLVLAIYIVASLVHFGIVTEKWSKKRSSSSHKLNAGIVYTSVIICALCCILYFVISLVILNIGFDDESSELCDAFSDVITFFFTLVIFSVNFFLWLRQRSLYTERLLSETFNRAIKVISCVSIFVILAGGLLVSIIASFANDIVSSVNGCSYSSGQFNRGIVVWIGVAFYFFGQISLLCLFIYPLQKSVQVTVFSKRSLLPAFWKKGKESASKCNDLTNRNAQKTSPFVGNLTASGGPSSEKVKKIIKKTLLFAILSIFCDLLTAVLPFFIFGPKTTHRRYVDLLALADVSLNLAFVILSFADWKKMISFSGSCCALSRDDVQ